MKKIILLMSLIFTTGIIIIGQTKSENADYKYFVFDCRGDSVKIKLPSDFIGPKYDNGEEGSIVSFVAPDLSVVSILCAGNTYLELNSNYKEIDSIIISKRIYNKLFYNKKKDLYARKLHTKKNFYLYQDASLNRKQELDKIFEDIEIEENKE